MNLNITIDWKFAVALGGSAMGIIFVLKINSDAVERVSTHVIDTCRDIVIADNSNY